MRCNESYSIVSRPNAVKRFILLYRQVQWIFLPPLGTIGVFPYMLTETGVIDNLEIRGGRYCRFSLELLLKEQWRKMSRR